MSELTEVENNFQDIFRAGGYNKSNLGRASEMLTASVIDTNRANGKFNTQRKDAHEEFFKMLVLSFKMNNVQIFPKIMEVSTEYIKC